MLEFIISIVFYGIYIGGPILGLLLCVAAGFAGADITEKVLDKLEE